MWRNCDKFITLESYELGTDRARGTTTIYIYSILPIGDERRTRFKCTVSLPHDKMKMHHPVFLIKRAVSERC